MFCLAVDALHIDKLVGQWLASFCQKGKCAIAFDGKSLGQNKGAQVMTGLRNLVASTTTLSDS
jgi:hypothetical protein